MFRRNLEFVDSINWFNLIAKDYNKIICQLLQMDPVKSPESVWPKNTGTNYKVTSKKKYSIVKNIPVCTCCSIISASLNMPIPL